MIPTINLAGCIILDNNGKVLLLHRKSKRIQWETPGGKIEIGESPEDAAIREIKEELGISVRIKTKLGTKDFIQENITMNYTWFLAETLNGMPQIIEDETFDQLRYISWEEMKNIKNELSENTINLLNAYLLERFEI